MSFVFYDLTFLFVFGIFLTIFLILNKKNIKREGILIIYRTKLGLKVINYLGKKYKNFLNKFEYVLIFFGYFLMISSLYFVFYLTYIFLKFPEFIKAVKIPPIAPLIPYLPQIFKADYLPMFYFTYWIIVLAVAGISHEFLHGIFAKAREVKIKSTGFAFLGPFVGAFVEPDENKVKKVEKRGQIAFLSAGSFSNLVMTLLFFFILWLFFVSAFKPAGVIFNTYAFSIINTSEIDSIEKENFFINFDGGLNLTKILAENKAYFIDTQDIKKLNNLNYVVAYEDAPALKAGLIGAIVELDDKQIKTHDEMKVILQEKKPGDALKIKTLSDNSFRDYKVILKENPKNKNEAYLGIGLVKTEGKGIFGWIRSKLVFFKDPNTYYKPVFFGDFIVFIYNLIWWIVLINISVALVNMLPVGIFDGGRVFFVSMLWLTGSEKIAKKTYKFFTLFILFIFILLTYLWFMNFFR